MADVFISYKSERRAAAQHLARVLELHGYSVWFDYGLYSGRDFGRQIERELQAARAVLVLWCTLSVDSEWVFAEAYKAKDMDKLIPARMEPAGIPVPFNVADTIDLESWDGAPRGHRLDRLLGEIARLTGREPVPAFNGLRTYDEQWRGLGALKLAQLPLSAKVQETETQAASFDKEALDRLRATAEALEGAATARQQAEAERHALEARIAAARAQEAAATAAKAASAPIAAAADAPSPWAAAASAAQAQASPPGLGQKQEEEPPTQGFEAWMRRYQRFLAPAGIAGVLLVGLLLIWRPWIPEWQRGKGEGPTAAVEEAAPAEAAPAEAALDARNTPATTRAPVMSNPASLPDFALFRDCTDCPEMVVIPAGDFQMGSPANEPGRYEDEDDTSGPGGRQVNVSVPRFAISRFETTWAEWAACVRAGACQQGPVDQSGGDQGWGRERRPVINVDWNDAGIFAGWVNRQIATSAPGPYRLPSEAEWEYAARGGMSTRWSFGDAESQLGTYAWFSGNSGERTQPVGGKAPNPFGLFDMHGNVREWAGDCYRDNLSGQRAAAYTTSGCSNRVARGGSWFSNPAVLRSANRSWGSPSVRSYDLGFRVARTL